jgi:predicted 3-demethylubiquinone-9 3-methyltransferase (glyoxalase superfamily)
LGFKAKGQAKNTICLWYEKDAEAAARSTPGPFPTARWVLSPRAPSDCPSGKEGNVLTSNSPLPPSLVSASTAARVKHSEAFSFQIATDDQHETDRYWNAIVGNGGQESACGWCKDKWGVSWQITPRVLNEALAAGGDESKRVVLMRIF